MHREIPVFKRCCICLPLRYGLLAWGYFKMIADAFILLMMSYSLIDIVMAIKMKKYRPEIVERLYTDVIIISILVTLFFADLIVTIVFIVGGHKKNVKLIRVFYILSIVMWVVTLLLSILGTVRTVLDLIKYQILYWDMILPQSGFYFVVLVVQIYFLLLLRSEIIKLRTNDEFRFVNIAAEAECTMTRGGEAAGDDTVKKVVVL